MRPAPTQCYSAFFQEAFQKCFLALLFCLFSPRPWLNWILEIGFEIAYSPISCPAQPDKSTGFCQEKKRDFEKTLFVDIFLFSIIRMIASHDLDVFLINLAKKISQSKSQNMKCKVAATRKIERLWQKSEPPFPTQEVAPPSSTWQSISKS